MEIWRKVFWTFLLFATLTNYEQVKRGVKATDTDRATEFIDLDLKVVTEKPVRHKIWNFKHKESQE